MCDFHFFFRFCVLFIPLSVHISFLWIELRWYICRLNICIFFGLNANTDLVLVFGFFLVLSVHDTHQLLALLCVCVRQIEQQAILMLLFIQPFFFFFFLFFHFFLYSSFIHFMYTFGSRESISQTPNLFQPLLTSLLSYNTVFFVVVVVKPKSNGIFSIKINFFNQNNEKSGFFYMRKDKHTPTNVPPWSTDTL